MTRIRSKNYKVTSDLGKKGNKPQGLAALGAAKNRPKVTRDIPLPHHAALVARPSAGQHSAVLL